MSIPSAPKVLRALLAADVVLVLIYALTAGVHGPGPAPPNTPLGFVAALFDLNREPALPTWYSSVQLLALGALAGIRALQSGKDRPLRGFFTAAFGGFLFWSMDEVGCFHERIRSVAEWAFPKSPLPHGAYWMVTYAVAASVVLVVFRRGVPAFLREPAAWVFLLGAAIWVGGGVGCEAVARALRVVYSPLESGLEEGLEMAGVSVMVYAILRQAGPLSLAWGTKAAGEGANGSPNSA